MKNFLEIAEKINFVAKIISAGLSVLLENIVAAFFWIFVWLAGFACIWLAGYSTLWMTIFFWAGFAALYLIGLSRFIIPSYNDILRRAERSSHLKHRPLASRHDQQATSGLDQMWRIEKDRQNDLLFQLRHSRPDLQLSRRDPYALRIAFAIIFICALFVIPREIIPRLKSGIFFSLNWQEDIPPIPFAQIHIIPPAYSGVKTVFFSTGTKKINVLAGSVIQADVETAWGKPILKMGHQNFGFKQKDNTGVWSLETKIPETGDIKITTYGITRFHQLVDWKNDSPPIIGWNGAIDFMPTGEMRIPLRIADDYGVAKLNLRAILAPGEEIPLFGTPLIIEKKINLSTPEALEIKPVFDTTGHVWAGRNASIIVEAEDFAGNISETAPLNIVLPVRKFKNPVAQRLAAIRFDLLNLRGVVSDTTGDVETLLYNPDQYGWDNVTTLGLRSVDSRLHYSHEKEALESSAATLWSLAMRQEEGKIGETQQSLKSVLEKLQNAIQRGADKSELAALMEQVQQALIQHLQNIAQKLQQNNNLPRQSSENGLNTDNLAAFLKKLQDDLVNGSKNSALQKLNQLQQLADVLNSSSADGMPKDMQEEMQALEDLQKIISRQRKNLDQTKQNSSNLPVLSREQKDIQKQTRQIEDKAQDKKSLNKAGQEMSQSADDLDKGKMMPSAEHQQKALDLLSDAAKSMSQDLQKKTQAVTGLSLGLSGPEDPLGRPQRALRDDGTRVPEGMAHKKTDDIIKNLREREGDMKRPLEERNYYKRLLKQW